MVETGGVGVAIWVTRVVITITMYVRGDTAGQSLQRAELRVAIRVLSVGRVLQRRVVRHRDLVLTCVTHIYMH